MSKGSKRRPGTGYAEGHGAIWGKQHTELVPDPTEYQNRRLTELVDEQAGRIIELETRLDKVRDIAVNMFHGEHRQSAKKLIRIVKLKKISGWKEKEDE